MGGGRVWAFKKICLQNAWCYWLGVTQKEITSHTDEYLVILSYKMMFLKTN